MPSRNFSSKFSNVVKTTLLILIIGGLVFIWSNYGDHILSDKFPSLIRKWEVYEDKEYGIILNYPQGWKYKTDGGNIWSKSTTFFLGDDPNTENMITIEIEPLRELITKEKYLDLIKSSILEHHEASKIIEQKDTLMLNTNAYEILYEFNYNDKIIRKLAVVTLRNKVGYIFYYEASPHEFSRYESLAQHIKNSLKFSSP